MLSLVNTVVYRHPYLSSSIGRKPFVNFPVTTTLNYGQLPHAIVCWSNIYG